MKKFAVMLVLCGIAIGDACGARTGLGIAQMGTSGNGGAPGCCSPSPPVQTVVPCVLGLDTATLLLPGKTEEEIARDVRVLVPAALAGDPGAKHAVGPLFVADGRAVADCKNGTITSVTFVH